MPLIRVVSRLGSPLPAPMQAFFGPGTGILGRSPDCTLSLPDENRHISRQQARVDVGAAGTTITCLSEANPLIVNGQMLGNGQSRRLAHGDKIQVAEYELRFEDDTRSDAARTSPAFTVPPRPGAGPAPLPIDPFDAFGVDLAGNPASGRADRVADRIGDPFAEPFGSSFGQPGEASPHAGGPGGGQAIPDGFDPFDDAVSPPLAASARQAPPRAGGQGGGHGGGPGAGLDPLGLGMAADGADGGRTGSAESIDALFGLAPGGTDPLGPDSPLGRPAGAPAKTPDRSGANDASMADDAPLLSGSFRLPQAIPPTAFGMADDAVVSWDQSRAPAGAPIARRLSPSAAPLAGAPMSPAPPAAVAPRVRATPPGLPPGMPPGLPIARPAAPPPARPRPGGQTDATQAALLDGLLQGLGIAELPRQPGMPAGASAMLTPELMHRIGELLAVTSDGLVGLLQARATLKRELRADVTMVGSHDNNPLKFAPDGQSALQQLLATQPVRGFMPPERAVQDACDDLIAHQIGMVAGMRAAMQGLIARFDPQALEQRLAPRSTLDALLPAARKARLWAQFESLFGDVSREAEDDFERLFGRAFVKAYEEQIDRIGAARQGDEGAAKRNG